MQVLALFAAGPHRHVQAGSEVIPGAREPLFRGQIRTRGCARAVTTLLPPAHLNRFGKSIIPLTVVPVVTVELH